MLYDEFVKRAREVHGDRYKYVPWEGEKRTHDKTQIICKEHGVFEQAISEHLQKKGSSICSGNCKITQEEFEMRVHEKHGDALDLSKAKYINGKTKVTCICKEHGEFSVTPESLWGGSGCPICNFVYSKSKNTHSFWKNTSVEVRTKGVLEKFNIIHDNKYDYSLINAITKPTDSIDIICPIHGKFKQVVANHLT